MKLSTSIVTKAAACLLMLALAATTQVVNGEKIIVRYRVMIHLCHDYDHVSMASFFVWWCVVFLTLCFVFIFFFNRPAHIEQCYENCEKAKRTCCGVTGDHNPCDDVGNDALDFECWQALMTCKRKCHGAEASTKVTADFDVDIEGAVVDEA